MTPVHFIIRTTYENWALGGQDGRWGTTDRHGVSCPECRQRHKRKSA